MPFVRVELAAFGVVEGRLAVLLIKRRESPHAGRWALPGGVLRIDLDADLDAAAQRVARERLQVALPYLRQQLAVGGKQRDERAPWALSVVYRAMVSPEALAATPGKRVDELRWTPVDEVGPDSLAFDHGTLVAQAAQSLREEVEDLRLPTGLVPASFVLSELQALCEAVLGRPLDKVSFRRRLAQRELVEPVEGELQSGVAHRPAQVYRLAGRG